MSELANPSGLWNTATGFVPIGSSATPFTGSLSGDGDGQTINGLVINNSTAANVGLFGDLGSGASVSAFGLTNANVTGTASGANVGALAGTNNGGSISSFYATGTVAGGSSASAGGLVGNNAGGSISVAYSTAAVSAGNNATVGGIAGQNGGTIAQSFAAGSVSAGTASDAGGFVGINNGGGSLSQSYATGAVSAHDGNIGGFVELNSGSVTQAYATGPVSGSGVFGFGHNLGTVTSSYFDSGTAGTATGDSTAVALTTAQFQAGLPTGFAAGTWTSNALINGGFPYITATAPQFSGVVYSDQGVTPLPGAPLTLLVNGISQETVTAGGDGRFDFVLGPGSTVTGDVLIYVSSGAVQANVFGDSIGGNFLTEQPDFKIAIYGGTLRLFPNETTLSQAIADLATALGGNGGAPFLFSVGPGNTLNLANGANLLIRSGNTLGSFTVNRPITLSGGGTFGLSALDDNGVASGDTFIVNQPIVAAGGVTFTTGQLQLGANVTTSGGPVTFAAPTVLETSVAIDMTNGGAVPAGATITFAGPLDGAVQRADDLTIAAGTGGDVNFQQRVELEFAAPGARSHPSPSARGPAPSPSPAPTTST